MTVKGIPFGLMAGARATNKSTFSFNCECMESAAKACAVP